MKRAYTVARIDVEGERFEILIKPEQALSYRLGRVRPVSEALAAEVVFTDAKKGKRPSEEKLRKAFGTTDMIEIADVILKKGTLQLTTQQRRQLIDDKRKQIISFISRQCVDPKTNMPHPPQRVKHAMEQIHYSINPFKSATEQAKEMIKLLRPILPLRTEQVSVEVRIPVEYAGKVHGKVKEFGAIKHEEWRADGSWYGVLDMPAGLYGPFLEKIGALTRGNVEAKLT